MPNDWFEFKQFKVVQSGASFKVGTDACLLGAWADVTGCNRILDLGTGSGVIALMLAQRSLARVTGIDRDAENALQAQQNFSNAPWRHRLEAFNIPLQEFKHDQELFDHIVCNPPYFNRSTTNSNERLHASRHDDSLRLDELFKHTFRLSAVHASLSLVYPFDRLSEAAQIARNNGWHQHRLTLIKPTQDKSPNRFLGEWKKTSGLVQQDTLIIYEPDRRYTARVHALLAPYYLKL